MNRIRILQLTTALFGAVAAAGAGAVPVTFSSATATFFQTFDRSWSPAEMFDGITSGNNGWAIFRNDGAADQTRSETALFTLATSLAAGNQNFTFTIQQNYGTSHELGDFSLAYTTAVAPTLASAATAINITSASATSGATFSSTSTGQLLVGGASAPSDVYTIMATVNSAAPITGIFLNAINDPASGLPTDGPGRQPGNGNFVVSEFSAVAVVPEPASLALLVAGLAAVGWRVRRNHG